MTRWSLFLQTLSLLHHFLGLYSSIDLAAQDVLIGNPSVQALSSQHTDLYLRHIQPSPVFGSVVCISSRSAIRLASAGSNASYSEDSL